MASLLPRILVLVIVFGLSVEDMSFSFRSQRDGYIYPSWKKKGKFDERFSNDAVVVGNDFMVLCGGIEETKGPSVFFSYSLCLKIAEELEKCAPNHIDDVFDRLTALLRILN